MTRRLASFVILAVAMQAFAASPPAKDAYDAAISAGRADIRGLLGEQPAPGLSIAVSVDGTIVWSEGFGLADVEQAVPATPATRYRLGSVSKLFTAAIATRLAERELLDLDAPVQRYVPSFPVKDAPISSRLLLGHLAGVRHYQNSDPIFAGKTYPSLADALSIFSGDPLVAAPGTTYTYTSYGFNLLGVVIEGSSGKSFEENLNAEVVKPLGLGSVALDEPSRIVPHRSAFYETRKETVVNAAPNDSSYKWPSGGLVASTEDLVRFASAHLQSGYLSEPMLTAMFTPQKLSSGKATNVGLAWRIDTAEDGVRYFHHGGTITGGRAFVLILPKERVAVAIATNLLIRFDEKLALAIARRFAK